MGELKAGKVWDVVGEGLDAGVCETAAATEVNVAEFAWRNYWEVGQRVDFGVFALDKEFEGVVIEICAVGCY